MNNQIISHIRKRKHKKQENQVIYETFIYNCLNRPFTRFKPDYNSIIPLDIYQTWFTKDLPDKMGERVELLKRCNPRFKHYLFDDNDCLEFIKQNFDNSVVNAYERLIPGAYKADLWRLCILYKKGGYYLDIKLACINGFRLIELSENEHYVKDRYGKTIFNSFMVGIKGSDFLLNGINQIVKNVQNNFYGDCPLHPTGPRMLGDLILRNNFNVNVDLLHYKGGGFIIYKKRFVISTEYPDYNDERTSTYVKHNTKRYDKLWSDHNIYH